jgi:hypothetical protein
MTGEPYYPTLNETVTPRGTAKTSPELADELYLAPRANLKGQASTDVAAALVDFLDGAYPRASGAKQKSSYLPGSLGVRRRQGIAALLSELLVAAAVESGAGWLMVSLNKNHFKRPAPVSWRTFDGIRVAWVGAGLLEENTGYPGSLAFGSPGPAVGRMSRFRATPRLLEICGQHGISLDNADRHFEVMFEMPSELVQLTSPRLPTPDTVAVHKLQDEVATLNAFFAKRTLSGARHVGWVRMFHEAAEGFNFDKGGRLYSRPGIPKLNYQQMPRDARAALLIDGEPISEIDISGSYLTIFYAAHGQTVDVAGAYDGILGAEGIHRAIVKCWINASFGNRGLLGQWSAGVKEGFAKRHRAEGWLIDAKVYPIARVRELTLARHPLLATWGQAAPGIPSSYGDLMFRESEVIISTMMRLASEHSIPALPVHDSILVPHSSTVIARGVLEEQFKDLIGVTPVLKVYPAA